MKKSRFFFTLDGCHRGVLVKPTVVLIKWSQIQWYLLTRLQNVLSVGMGFGISNSLSLFFLKAFLIFGHCSYVLLSTRNTFSWVLWCCSCGRMAGGYFEDYRLSLRWSSCYLTAFLYSDFSFPIQGKSGIESHCDAFVHLRLSPVVYDSLWMLCLKGLRNYWKHLRIKKKS